MIGWNKIVVVLLVILLVLNLFIYIELKGIRKSAAVLTGNIHNELRWMQNDINSIQNLIEKKINQNEWIQNKNFKILGLGDADDTIEVLINWRFTELNPGTQVNLLYGSMNDYGSVDDWKQVSVESDTLNYSKIVELSGTDNYKFQVCIKNEAKIKTQPLMDINIDKILNNRVNFEVGYSNKAWELRLINPHRGLDFLKIKTAEVRIFKDNKLVKTAEMYKASGDLPQERSFSKKAQNAQMKIKIKPDGETEIWYYKEESSPDKVVIAAEDHRGKKITKSFNLK